MKRRVYLLRFKTENGITVPEDAHLNRLAEQWAEKNLASPVNFLDYRQVWVCATGDKDGVPDKVEGVIGIQFAVDASMFRFTSAASAKMLIDRANDYLHDQGWRGSKAFVYISDTEAPEQRCPDYKGWLEALECRPAERYLYTIR